MTWFDRIAENVQNKVSANGPLIIRDEKTVSGRVHVGSMRGVAIHGFVADALMEKGIANTFIYEFNDFDPMDDIPANLPRETYEEHLGKPLKDAPSPDGKAKNFAEYFANDFRAVIEKEGFSPQFSWSSELYTSGKMDSVIREALEGADAIRRIQKEVSGADRKPGWLPISVVCPACGKMTTTEATDFDGETVLVNCLPDKVAYTHGCGFEGRLSPFGGAAKLYWKAEWPAKWKVYGVQVEGGGKDHSTKGGSRDVGNHIVREVYHYEPPFDIPYEFFLVGGKKMSSSKGRGSSAAEIAALLPPKLFRFAMLTKDINQAINFDPEGDTIPVLYDLYDKYAESFWSGAGDDYARTFAYAHVGRFAPKKMFLPRFSQVAFLVQMPHLTPEKEVAALKGEELTKEDKAELEERAQYARQWLEAYAPEKFVFKLQDSFPEAARALSDTQKKAMMLLAEYFKTTEKPSGEEVHAKLHALKDEAKITPADLFSALYLLFLGKSSGPKAGWFLSVLEKDFVVTRLQEGAR